MPSSICNILLVGESGSGLRTIANSANNASGGANVEFHFKLFQETEDTNMAMDAIWLVIDVTLPCTEKIELLKKWSGIVSTTWMCKVPNKILVWSKCDMKCPPFTDAFNGELQKEKVVFKTSMSISIKTGFNIEKALVQSLPHHISQVGSFCNGASSLTQVIQKMQEQLAYYTTLEEEGWDIASNIGNMTLVFRKKEQLYL